MWSRGAVPDSSCAAPSPEWCHQQASETKEGKTRRQEEERGQTEGATGSRRNGPQLQETPR